MHTGYNATIPQHSHLGYKSSPLVWYKNRNAGEASSRPEVVVLSHLSHFKHAVMFANGGPPTPALSLGLSGELTSIPSGTRYAAMLYHKKSTNIRDTMYNWGALVHAFVRTEHNGGKRKLLPDETDPVLANLGFFTDNGAQFYADSYNAGVPRGTGRGLNLTCCGSDKIYPVIGGGGKKGVPRLQYLQLDDWWYQGVYPGNGQDWGVKCVESWDFPAEVGRRGANFSDIGKKFPGTKLMLYGPFFCPNQTVVDDSKAVTWVRSGLMPVLTPRGTDGSARHVYRELFQKAKAAFGEVQNETKIFTNFEIDFMNELFLKSAEFRTTLGLYDSWLQGLDEAARDNDIFVQYCMMLPSDVFVALKFDRTTNGRASDDYAAVHTWDVFASSLLLDSLHALRPSKDNFWSSATYPDDSNFNVINENGGNPADNILVHSLVAGYSLGPVGVSDMVLNGTVLERLARNDGVLLRPETPLTLDADAVLGESDGGRSTEEELPDPMKMWQRVKQKLSSAILAGVSFWLGGEESGARTERELGGELDEHEDIRGHHHYLDTGGGNKGLTLLVRRAAEGAGSDVPWDSDPADMKYRSLELRNRHAREWQMKVKIQITSQTQSYEEGGTEPGVAPHDEMIEIAEEVADGAGDFQTDEGIMASEPIDDEDSVNLRPIFE
eukprot:g14764.t1